MNLRPPMDFLRRSWVLMVVLAAAGAGVAGGYLATIPPHYEATAQVYVSQRQAAYAELVAGNGREAEIAASTANLISAPIVLEPVIQELGLHETAKRLAERVQAKVVPDTVLIDITASDASASKAAAIANAVAHQAVKVARGLSPQDSSGRPSITLRQVRAAMAPTTPAMQALLPLLLLGLLGGGVFGALIAGFRGGSDGGDGGFRLAPTLQTT